MLKGNKIIVTGAAGYIGDAVCASLIGTFEKDEIIAVDKLMYQDVYLRPSIDFRCLDINSDAFFSMLEKEIDDVCAIIHLAAIVGDGACQALPEITVETNENFVKKLVAFLEKRKPSTRLIFASTASVYGESHETVDENSPTRPLSLYAGTKLNAENAIRNSTLENYVIFRLGTLFGMSTSYGRVRADLVVNILTFKACQSQPITVFGGEQWRPLINVLDVAIIMASSVFKDYKGVILLAHANYTIKEVSDIILNEIPGSEVTYIDSKFEDLRNYRVCHDKAKSFGIFANRTVKDGIRAMRDTLLSGRIKNPWISKHHNAAMAKEFSGG